MKTFNRNRELNTYTIEHQFLHGKTLTGDKPTTPRKASLYYSNGITYRD